ncbi:MAG: LysR family transcriptional regulator [Lachnospiraceae bacterium]|nr:LysR family transcriptional regulator [Lachnospiraceae bacterium]
MTIHQIECFCALAQYQNFTRAAQSLYLSQSAFSRAIAALEAETGTELFVRDKANPRLTKKGREILPFAQDILTNARSIEKSVRKVEEKREGTIVLGVFRFGLLNLLPYLKAEYKQLHPTVHFDMIEHTGVSIFPALRAGEVDLTHTNYIPQTYSRNFCTLRLGEHRHKAFLPANHPLAGEESIDLYALRAERFVTVDRQQFPLINSRMVGLCADAGFSPNVVREFDTYTNIFDYVAEGRAVAVMAMPDPHIPGVRAVLLRDIAPDPTFLVWSASNRKPEVLGFVDYVRQQVENGRVREITEEQRRRSGVI